MYPDPRVVELITRETIPVRAHIKEQPAMWKRFNARWTPTILFLDWDGREQYRIEGFLPTDEFLGHLQLGLGYAAAGEKEWETAEVHFGTAAEEYGNTSAGPEGMYWRGVSRYSATHDAGELRALARAFETRYADTAWAKRSVVWRPKDTARTGQAAA